jgi:uncharacterized GH25 family protein
MTVRAPLRCAAALLLLLEASSLQAHDLWIEPSGFRPAPRARLAVHLRVGEAFHGEPVPRMPERIERFAAVGPGGDLPLDGVAGADPAGYAALPAPGTWTLVYDSNPSRIELEGAKFESYLAEEGLERISRLRRERGQTAAPARELYSRSVKSLVRVGDSGEGFDRVVGIPLELVAEADPSALAAGGELPVRLLFQGKPLAGALVVAIPRGAPETRVSARTDAQGRVRLRLGQAGDWLVKTVHMEPAPAGSGADWESLWASLTFRAGS